ncbi:MAG TPA: glycoside hydrolase family 3 protein [Candidatus Limnocylindrales bacterium]|nr:glycoside hydrolase family 3 protein [Candidatus Limnocylindrales bacterium]
MTARRLTTLVLCLALIASACGTPAPSASPAASAGPSVASPGSSSAAAPWLDPTAATDDRVAALLAEMTLAEKIGQMTLVEKGSIDAGGVRDAVVGGVLSGGGGSPPDNTPAGWHEMVAAYQSAASETRLGIPILYGVDAVHGHNNVIGATIFPHNIGLGAVGDPALVEKVGRATALETAATGIRWDYAPVIAVPQDIRWGRTYEGYGESTALVAGLGSAFVRGLQGGGNLAADGAVAATPKHFVGDGGTAWGTSGQGGYRIDQGVTAGDEALIRELYLPPYEDAIEAGARIIMASFSGTEAGGKIHGDRHWLTEVLKDELGFSGFLVSDWEAINQVDSDYTTAVTQSINAGIDMVMVPYDYTLFQRVLTDVVAGGGVAQERIDDAVARILRVKFEMGLFEQPMPDLRETLVGAADHRTLAREAVARSMTLLKTTGDVLPLRGDADVLLAGAGADDIGIQSGGWTISWQGSDGEITPGTSIAEGLVEEFGDRVRLVTPRELNDAAPAKVGVLVIAERPYAEGVGDSAVLRPFQRDVDLLPVMRSKVDRLIVLLVSGRPLVVPEVFETADAVVAAWLPGTEGAGVADVLAGKRPFEGRTPYTWPVAPDDAPRTGKDACDGAVFPAGYGLAADGRLLGEQPCPGG